MNLKKQLIRKLAEATTSAFSVDHLPPIHISPPKNPTFGDLSSNLPLLIAKLVNEKPMTAGERLKSSLKVDPAIITEVSITKPGFINFHISPLYYQSLLQSILDGVDGFQGSDVGTGKNKKAIVEFVSANPTGPLSIGHGRQAVLGDCVANILSWHGYKVTREYYYNNAGRQMRLLAESVEARYREQTGETTDFPEEGYQGDYIRDIAESVLKEYGSRLKLNDPVFRSYSEDKIFREIKNVLKSIHINFDNFANERDYYESGAIDKVIKKLRDKDLVYEADGATWFRVTALGKPQDRVLIKSSGEPTYRLPDIAYHIHKVERKFGLIVDIFGADHQDTYPDVLAGIENLGYSTEHIKVLIHQFVTLTKGGERVKMSTRKATYVTLEELIDRFGPDVVRYFYIMRGMNSHLNFDMALAADQSENNPVYYLQYAHARICNIIKHGEREGVKSITGFTKERLEHPSELALMRSLASFPNVLDSALETLEPQTIANFLQSLAAHFHKFYTDCRVITSEKQLSKARLALISAVKTVLENGLNILGINAPQKM
jgi:arginyl-tRNA synthetase